MKMNNYPKIFVIFIALFGFFSVALAANLTTGVDEQAKLPYWQIKQKGMSLRLVQRLPIQTRAFYQARGFNKKHSETIAQSCLFQTVFKNISDQQSITSPLTYDLDDWVITYQGKKQKMKLREEWDEEWQTKKIKTPQRLAFEWGLYPTSQTYKPGDYNWGLSVFNLKPGSRFNLEIVWWQYGKKYEQVIRNIQCAEDINPQPTENL